MRAQKTTQVGPGVRELLDAGVPLGPLAEPNRFYRTSSGGKFHATDTCPRLSSRRGYRYAQPVDVDLSVTKPEAFCAECGDQPTDVRVVQYSNHARRTLRARHLLTQLCEAVATDQAATELDTEPGTGSGEVRAIDADTLATATRTTWHRVAQAKAVRALIASVHQDPTVHPEMKAWSHETYELAVAVHEHLHTVAEQATDTELVLRSCVVDLLGRLTSNQGPRHIEAPVADTEQYPALCQTGFRHGSHRGFKNKVTAAWLAWGDRVKLDGNLDQARAAAHEAGDVCDLTPEHVPQLPTGPARTPAPASGSPWDWLVAEWRAAATTELDSLVDEWERSYTANLAVGRTAAPQLVALTDWSLTARTNVNASTELLAHLDVVTDPDKEFGLVVAAAPVAAWLGSFGVNGIESRPANSWQATSNGVHVLTDAGDADTAGVLGTCLRMWEMPGKSARLRRDPEHPMRDLRTVLDLARGIHHADNPERDPEHGNVPLPVAG